MRKIVIVTILGLSLSLGGCSTLGTDIGSSLGASLGGVITNILQGSGVGAVSIANPVTKDRLNQLENGAIVVFSLLDGWKKSCVQALLPPSCKQQIAAVQVYTRQIPPYLTQLRTFVKTNDQVNAIVVYNNVMNIISTVRAQAAANGINSGV